MTRRRVFYPLFLVSLALLIFIPQNAHAGTNIVFKSFCDAFASSVTTINCTIGGLSTGDALIVNIFGVGVFNGFTTTDGQSNSYSQKIFSLTGNGAGVSTYIQVAITASGGSTTVTVATGGPNRIYEIVVSDYSGVTGFGKTGTDQQDSAGNSGSSTISLTGTLGSSLMIDDFTTGGSTMTISSSNGQSIRDSASNGGFNPCQNTCKASDSVSPILGWTWSGGTNCTPCFASHSSLELQGGTSATITTVVQCYGNCGTPAVTLVNTNSTHFINFNQSLTEFYEFQSNLNGFIINITTSIAKSYTNGQQVSLGVYEANCNAGVTPFTISCPGQLEATLNGNVNPFKGKTTLTPATLTVGIGEWVAIAVTATFSGLDLNDTNTNVPLFQQTGRIPQILSGAGTTTCACKMGLWAFINGNAITGIPPPSVIISCGADLVCILLQAVLALTPTNPLLGAIALGIIWSIITIVSLEAFFWKFGMQGALPAGVYIIIFVAWMTFFASLVGAVWFIILEILITVIIFSSFFGSLASSQFKFRGRGDA